MPWRGTYKIFMSCFGWGQKHLTDKISAEILSTDNWLVLVNFRAYLGLDLVMHGAILISSTATCSLCCCQVLMYLRTTTQWWQWWKTAGKALSTVVLEQRSHWRRWHGCHWLLNEHQMILLYNSVYLFEMPPGQHYCLQAGISGVIWMHCLFSVQ